MKEGAHQFSLSWNGPSQAGVCLGAFDKLAHSRKEPNMRANDNAEWQLSSAGRPCAAQVRAVLPRLRLAAPAFPKPVPANVQWQYLVFETQEVVPGVVEKGKIVGTVTDRQRVVAVG
jgi:hypothetical protein